VGLLGQSLVIAVGLLASSAVVVMMVVVMVLVAALVLLAARPVLMAGLTALVEAALVRGLAAFLLLVWISHVRNPRGKLARERP
jgi:uncharacterized membrane-anchored protein